MNARIKNSFLTAQQAQQGGISLIKPTLRAAGQIAPYAVGGLGSGIIRPALAFGGVNAASTALQGDLKAKDLAKSFALGAAPVGVGKAIAVGARGITPTVKVVQKYDKAQNQIGAVGKNVKPNVPEVPAGQALDAQGARKLASDLTTPPKPPTFGKPPLGTKPLGVVKTVATSEQTTPKLSAQIQGSYNPLGNKTAMKAASQRIAADPNAAYHFAATTHSAEGNATAIQIAKTLESQGKHAEAADLMTTKAQQALQAGQGNQIYSMWDKLSPETVAQTAAKTIEKYNATARKPIPGLSAEQYKGFVAQAAKIKTLAEGSRERGIATQSLLRDIGSLVPSKGGDKAFSLYRTGLLTGFRTPGKVLVSHAISSTFEQAKNIPAAGVDMATSLITGKRGLSLTPRGNISGFGKGTLAAVDNLVHKYDTPGSGGIARDFASNVHFGNSVAGRIAQNYVDTVGRLHGSLYKPFFGAQHLNSLHDMAITNAKNVGLKGAERDSFITKFVKDATDYSIKDQSADPHANFSTPEGAAQRANAEAQYTTFQNPTLLSKIASGAKKGSGNPTRYVVPFSQIPSSIASKIIDYTPVGAIKEAVTQASRGSFDQRALSQAIGRGATGTGIAALGYHLFNSGNITTAYPTDKKTQAQWELEGKQANSILVGGKWRQLASFGPAGDTLAVGANVAEGMKGNKKTPGSITNAAIQGGIGGENVLANSPYLQGIQNIGTAIGSPGTKSQKVAEGLAGGTIPTGIANIATATDPLQRQTNSIADSVTNKIPGVRENNLPQVDVLGRPIPRAQGVLGTLADPFYSTTAKSDPLTKEFNRLDASFNPATPTALTKNQSIAGQKLSLNPAQLTQLQQQSGGALNTALNSLIQSPSYKSASDQTKANVINSTTTTVRDQVKASIANGDISSSGTPLIDPTKITQTAQKGLDKQKFIDSGKSFSTIGNNVWTMSADGTAKAVTKDAYNYTLGGETLTNMKNNENLQGYINTAKSQLDLINKQLNDPNVSSDPAQVLKLQNDAYTLQSNIDKYTSYGGFTKGSSGGSKSTALKTTGFKTASSSNAPKLPSIKVAKAKAFKAPKTSKISVSKIPSNYLNKKIV